MSLPTRLSDIGRVLLGASRVLSEAGTVSQILPSRQALVLPTVQMSDFDFWTAAVVDNNHNGNNETVNQKNARTGSPLYTSEQAREWQVRSGDSLSHGVAVPTSAASRVFGFGVMAAKVAAGTVGTLAKNVVTASPASLASAALSEANAERLTATLCRMRGAALKLGQVASIQDVSVLPEPLPSLLKRVRDDADVMPVTQQRAVLTEELGDWQHKFAVFDEAPIAAASIGQVHRAVLPDGRVVAVKLQYPGVADAVDSDLSSLRTLLSLLPLPPSLFIERILEFARAELRRECDYNNEAKFQEEMRHLIANDPTLSQRFYVPAVVPELSTRRVLVSEMVRGVPLDQLQHLPQEERDSIAQALFELTMRELFEFRLMQTDPNWSNFLYDEETRSIALIDFGATSHFAETFADDYLQLVLACADNDHDRIKEFSTRLGFMTGEEGDSLQTKYALAGAAIGLPFRKEHNEEGGFDFRQPDIMSRMSAYASDIMRERHTPPPVEAYSLHRKLTGAFLTAIKLRARVDCRASLQRMHAAFLRRQQQRLQQRPELE